MSMIHFCDKIFEANQLTIDITHTNKEFMYIQLPSIHCNEVRRLRKKRANRNNFAFLLLDWHLLIAGVVEFICSFWRRVNRGFVWFFYFTIVSPRKKGLWWIGRLFFCHLYSYIWAMNCNILYIYIYMRMWVNMRVNEYVLIKNVFLKCICCLFREMSPFFSQIWHRVFYDVWIGSYIYLYIILD